jgi:hypothetical protein
MDPLRLVDQLDDLIHNAKPLPLSSQVRIDPDKAYDLLDQLRASLPGEIEAARAIVAERKAPEPPPTLTPPPPDDENRLQRRVLAALVKADPSLVNLGDLEQQFPGAERAVTALVGAGLASRLGDGIGASPAAVRCAALTSR